MAGREGHLRVTHLRELIGQNRDCRIRVHEAPARGQRAGRARNGNTTRGAAPARASGRGRSAL